MEWIDHGGMLMFVHVIMVVMLLSTNKLAAIDGADLTTRHGFSQG